MEKSEKDFLKWIREANWAWKFCIQKNQKKKDLWMSLKKQKIYRYLLNNYWSWCWSFGEGWTDNDSRVTKTVIQELFCGL